MTMPPLKMFALVLCGVVVALVSAYLLTQAQEDTGLQPLTASTVEPGREIDARPNEPHTREEVLPETSGLLADSGKESTESQDEDPEELSWNEKYRKASLEDLILVHAVITETIETETMPEFRWRFDSGLAEYMGEGPSLPITDHDPLEISAYLFEPQVRGGGILKVVLPREEFAELYELKAELVWVEAAIDERYQSAAATPRGRSRRDR